MRAAGGRFLARGEPAHTFEGGQACRTMVIEFDSVGASSRCEPNGL
jgi:uncharacterized protein (DUF1330 family)